MLVSHSILFINTIHSHNISIDNLYVKKNVDYPIKIYALEASLSPTISKPFSFSCTNPQKNPKLFPIQKNPFPSAFCHLFNSNYQFPLNKINNLSLTNNLIYLNMFLLV